MEQTHERSSRVYAGRCVFIYFENNDTDFGIEWDRIFPAMESLYHVSKTKKQVEEVLERAVLRYVQFRSEHPPETKRLMPGARDFVEGDNFFSSFIIENREDCSDEKLDALMPEIVANTQDFLPNVENSLVDMILKHDPSQPRDRKILDRAANLFLCGCRKCWQIRENMNLKVVKPYAEVIDHVLGTDDLESGVIGWTGNKICVDPLVLQAGRDILEVLGLPPDSTRDEVAKLGKLECRCGHHGYSDVALTFEQLVRTIHLFIPEITLISSRPSISSRSENGTNAWKAVFLKNSECHQYLMKLRADFFYSLNLK